MRVNPNAVVLYGCLAAIAFITGSIIPLVVAIVLVVLAGAVS